MIDDKADAKIICSLKNTGYRTLNDVQISLWSDSPIIDSINYDSIKIELVSEHNDSFYKKRLFKVPSSLYPGEIATYIIFMYIKTKNGKKDDPTVKSSISLRAYSENTPGILIDSVSKDTNYEMGPYLRDFLKTIAWMYIVYRY